MGTPGQDWRTTPQVAMLVLASVLYKLAQEKPRQGDLGHPPQEHTICPPCFRAGLSCPGFLSASLLIQIEEDCP
jgi:hypothetical protein